jgi:GGDEF domain-containing protein
MAGPFSHAASLSDDENALLKRVAAGVACKSDAEPAVRELIESVLAARIEELHAANTSLEREVQERRLVELVARADAALYAAKRAGKDRVEVYWRREPAPAGPGGA